MRITHPSAPLTLDVDEAVAARYVSQGWRPATPAAPKGNASRDEWAKFARSQGLKESDIEGRTRDELRAALS